MNPSGNRGNEMNLLIKQTWNYLKAKACCIRLLSKKFGLFFSKFGASSNPLSITAATPTETAYTAIRSKERTSLKKRRLSIGGAFCCNG
jgi:hypothetical protein